MSVVLHVSEAWGGGIVTATEWIAAQAPEHEHHVLYLPRGEIGRAPDDKIFARAFEHNGGRRSFVRHARRMLASPTYDIVHSHSSWAGVICRTFARPDARQFYSPHCFASERRDISQASRWLFELVERVGASRTDTLVANGTHEAELAAALGHRHILNLPMIGLTTSSDAVHEPTNHGFEPTNAHRRPTIVTVGRVAPQKDPEYFAKLISGVRRRLGAEVDAVWVGAPDKDNIADVLTRNDIRVTGWLDAKAVAAELANATCYVHSAAWEAGAPLSMLEAARSGTPVVARDQPCLSWTGFATAASLSHHVSTVAAVCTDPSLRAAILQQSLSSLRHLEQQARTVNLSRHYGSPIRLLAA